MADNLLPDNLGDHPRTHAGVVQQQKVGEQRRRPRKIVLDRGPAANDLRYGHIMAGPMPYAESNPVDVDGGGSRADEHSVDVVTERVGATHDVRPRSARIGALEAEGLAAFQMAFNAAIHPLPRLTLQRRIVMASEALGDAVGVVEIRGQLPAMTPCPSAFAGAVGADHDGQPRHRGGYPAGGGMYGYSRSSGSPRRKWSTRPSGQVRVTVPSEIRRCSTTPLGSSAMTTPPSSSGM